MLMGHMAYCINKLSIFLSYKYTRQTNLVYDIYNEIGDGREVRWCWVNFQCRGVLLFWIRVGQGPTTLEVGAGGGCLDIFLSSIISLFFLPLSGRRPDKD